MLTLLLSAAWADPCGMVPPIWTGDGPRPTVERQGLQQTYVFFRGGVQTIAIRPGFTGSVDQFGMLVPLPATPALRKIDDRTFDHLASAVDPPIVDVQIIEPVAELAASPDRPSRSRKRSGASEGLTLRRDEVRVMKEEAVGMYEVAVLAAGSSTALRRWMDEHRFRYPDGMDATIEDYVAARWQFVAIKARVGASGGVQPSPGQRGVDAGLPAGASFDGFVQGMAFRFEIDAPVIPMRLAVFNGDDTHNRVYVLTEGPVTLPQIPDALVRRQVAGATLHHNLTAPLSFRLSNDGRPTPVEDEASLPQHWLDQITPDARPRSPRRRRP